ncbi:hypothetical protein UK15_13560 [Streptomyces variegatus]|uniref:Uncharacterized protein n=1 Tax=Streptomyces variegatus TaxID=284040 RepID=A0A0M2GU02_9ACTN|nr:MULTISPECIES: RRQRL motif-containing zinc-binding protein [Streptomyces]KJK38969.1 hypothetical protein UK15_13560 [Streptomyces variegatus]
MATIPTYRWRLAPDGLATRRQLRALGLRPGGQEVAAQVERPRRRREPLVAYLYAIEQARAALAKANAARRICPECRRDAGYVIPTSLGMCVTCACPDEQRAA